MAYYTDNMTQAATYFPPNGQNGFGDLQFDAAVSVSVRWQDRADLIRDVNGREIVAQSVVYVSQSVASGGRLGLGALTDPDDAREIRNVSETPSLDGAQTLVKAWL